MTSRTWPEVGQILKRRREVDLGLTQPELADKCGLSVPMIQVLESGRRDSFSGRTLGKIARGLDWPNDVIERLLAGEDPRKIATSPADEAPSIDLNSDLAALPPESQQRILDIIAEEKRKQQT